MAKKTLLEARKTRAIEGIEARLSRIEENQEKILALLSGGKAKAKAGKADAEAEAKPDADPEAETKPDAEAEAKTKPDAKK